MKKYIAVLPWGLFAAVFAAATSLPAQDIIMSTPRDPVIPSVLRDLQPSAPASQPPAPPETPYKIGNIVLHPRLSYGYMNAEGLPAPDGRRVASEIHTLAAGLSADLGEHLSLDYSPTWMNYTARAMSDSFDQSASLSGAFTVRDLGVQFSEAYVQSRPTLVETGQQTKQKTWATSLATSYSVNPMIQLQASANIDERYTDLSPDTRTWSTGPALNLVFSPRLSLNLGPRFSYTEIPNAPDLYDESYNARFTWRPTDKLTIAFGSGMQYNHSTSSAGVDLSSPLQNFSLDYQPFATTTLSFNTSRTVAPSYFQDQVIDTLRWSVAVNQRLFGRFYVNASYAPYDTTYIATDTVTGAGRKDSVKSYSAGLVAQLFGRLSVSASYSLTQNDSNTGSFSFSTKQYGIQLRYSY